MYISIMKFHHHLFAYILVLAAGTAAAQSKMLVRNGCAVDDAEMNRNHYVFDPSDEAQQIIAVIMDANILDPNFTIKSGDVDNALATFENGQRYIIYNTAYIERIKQSAGTDWAAYYVFAHEIGHHLNNHRFDLSDSDARKEQELRADVFAGGMLYRLGAPLNEAHQGVEPGCKEKESHNHPPLRGEMEAGMKEVKFECDFAAFVKVLNTDPKFFHTGPEALLAGYRDIAKRIDPELPKLFAELPRAPYGVRAMPAHQGSDAAEYYDGSALDGSHPGWFNANAQAWKTRPIWGMETLVAHETVPGHHLQIARAVELGELPKFRRGGGFTVYGEGWALYAETLGFDLGLYKDPYSRFGHLQWQAFRAARLVVDTGIHAMGWSRQRAIDFMVERTGEKPDFVASEVDRYMSWPGQALAYMIGQLKIVELRDRAKVRLGERFDIRKFHQVVLDQGSVPLPMLERAVDDWLAAAGA